MTNNGPKSYNEWKAHYLAVRERLGGVGKSAGVIPVAMVARPIEEIATSQEEIEKFYAQQEKEKIERFFTVNNLPKNNFYRLLVKVAKENDIEPDVLLKNDRRVKIVNARTQLIVTAKDEFKYSFAQIGRWLNKDHTSILHAYYNFMSRLEKSNASA